MKKILLLFISLVFFTAVNAQRVIHEYDKQQYINNGDLLLGTDSITLQTKNFRIGDIISKISTGGVEVKIQVESFSVSDLGDVINTINALPQFTVDNDKIQAFDVLLLNLSNDTISREISFLLPGGGTYGFGGTQISESDLWRINIGEFGSGEGGTAGASDESELSLINTYNNVGVASGESQENFNSAVNALIGFLGGGVGTGEVTLTGDNYFTGFNDFKDVNAVSFNTFGAGESGVSMQGSQLRVFSDDIVPGTIEFIERDGFTNRGKLLVDNDNRNLYYASYPEIGGPKPVFYGGNVSGADGVTITSNELLGTYTIRGSGSSDSYLSAVEPDTANETITFMKDLVLSSIPGNISELVFHGGGGGSDTIHYDESNDRLTMGPWPSNNFIIGAENSHEYTPSGDYNPATKKYVDDYVENNTLTLDNSNPYTPTLDYHPATKEYADHSGDGLKEYVDTTFVSKFNTSFQRIQSQFIIDSVVGPALTLNSLSTGPTAYLKFTTKDKYNKSIHPTNNSSPFEGFYINENPSDIMLTTLNQTPYTPTSLYHPTPKVYVDTVSLIKTNLNPYIPTADYNPATKKYVDDNAGVSKEYVDTTFLNTNVTYAQYINSQLQINTSIDPPLILNRSGGGDDILLGLINRSGKLQSIGITDSTVFINGDNHFILTRDNEIKYTPIGDYNPATKKYVDNNSSAWVKDYVDTTFVSLWNNGIQTIKSQLVIDSIQGYAIQINGLTGGANPSIKFTTSSGYNKVLTPVDGSSPFEGFYINENPSDIIITSLNQTDYTPTAYTHPATKGYVDDNTITRTNTDVYNPTLDYHPATKKYVDDNSVSPDDVLTKTNILSYFPTADYHPATKKYVDDNSIPADSVLTLGNSDPYTPQGDYNPATKKYVDDNAGGVTQLYVDTSFVFKNSPLVQSLNTRLSMSSDIGVPLTIDRTGVSDQMLQFINQDASINSINSTDSSVYVNNTNNFLLTPTNNIAYNITSPYQPTTKLYVDDNTITRTNTDAYTPTLDYHPATKKYVDDNILSGDVTKLYVDSTFVSKVSTSIQSINASLNIESSAQYPLQIYSDGVNSPTINFRTQSGWQKYLTPFDVSSDFAGFYINNDVDNFYLNTKNTTSFTPTLNTHPATKGYVDDNVLLKTNISAYTPTLDYHPATKKYVDDNILSGDVTKLYVDSTFINKVSGLEDVNSLLRLHLYPIIDNRGNADNAVMQLIDTAGVVKTIYSNDSTIYIDDNLGDFLITSQNNIEYPIVSDHHVITRKYYRDNTVYKNNTTPYTPTSDYHPATKKYVDDNSAGYYWRGRINATGIIQSQNSNISATVSVTKTGTGVYEISKSTATSWSGAIAQCTLLYDAFGDTGFISRNGATNNPITIHTFNSSGVATDRSFDIHISTTVDN